MHCPILSSVAAATVGLVSLWTAQLERRDVGVCADVLRVVRSILVVRGQLLLLLLHGAEAALVVVQAAAHVAAVERLVAAPRRQHPVLLHDWRGAQLT